ncbi:MAG: molybdopterin cofactor-binding domain-containing protein, partial [Alphaproteobacteria bacterium]
GSTAIVGGVAFGYYAYKKPVDNPLLDDLTEGETTLNPYLLIDQSGVTIITPRADIGQGAYSVLAALVAEELDIAWQDIKVDPGPPSAAYYNGKVAAEGFPIAATAEGFIADNARAFGDVVAKFMGLQLTGGSSTVPDGFMKMRMAGATARQALLQAAVNRTSIPLIELKTHNGAVLLPDGSSFRYEELAEAAALIKPPKDVMLKPESEWRYLGKDMQRIDILAKSTGTLTYGLDLEFPDMVYATTRTNPRIGGGMKSFDSRAAEVLRGVHKIIEIDGGIGVIADNTWRAFQAAQAVEIDWDDAPYPATSAAMWDTVSNSFTKDLQDSQFKDDGDVENALTESEMIEAEYRIPYLAHAAMEPLNATARLKDGKLDIWVGTQIPMFVLASVSRLTGLNVEDIHLHNQYSGGSFGRRLEDDFILQTVQLSMAMEGVPVKMIWSREEDMTHDFPRPMAMSRAQGSVKDGKVHAYDLGIASQSVAASQTGRLNQSLPGPDTAIVAGAWDQPFAIPHYRVTGYRVPEMVPVSSWRSVGASGNGFLHDCFLDELIHAAGADPLAERIRLVNHDLSRKVLEEVGEMSNWGAPLGLNQGRGVAFTLSFGVPVAEVVEVTNTPDGIRIDNVFVAVEVGKILDPVNFENQVQGGVIWGLSHAMMAELTYDDGKAEQDNFHAFEAMRHYQTPEIIVRGLENGDTIRGIGEPSVPPAAPALANAIFAATG